MTVPLEVKVTTPISVSEMETDTIQAPAGEDLVIQGRTSKDIIAKLGDASGAKKLIIKDSANAEQVSIDSDGLIIAKKLKGNLPIATVAGAPTEARCISAFGAIADNAGLEATYIDSTAETGSTYRITCDGVKYYATDLASDVLS